ncbi:cell surface protein [Ligilactobacillus agilis]|uniref:Cell surface protein n=1 Tax=Ligilactobacillus agilis TaxID=1601 RepID=A0A6F9Y208_9LACO|nr:L,D-transpeptidase [Ligilactobacillus agilis]GET11522.1 cell surface protein [Ligilactobacillus agilis]
MRKFFKLILLVLLFIGGATYYYHHQVKLNQATTLSSRAQSKVSPKKTVMRTPINWRLPSETVAYPDLKQLNDFWIKVVISKNRVYLMDGKKVVYTMYASAGEYERQADGKKKSTTPTGTYYIQAERGDSFYNSNLNEGANYWTSWLNHGEYLFHTVPTDANGNYKVAEAKKLGKKPASHGCIRLSVADAKWINQNVPQGTKVVITD